MLSESVVAEQYRVACEIGEHAVRPVEHRRFDKNQLLPVADIQSVPGLHGLEIPVLMVMPAKRLLSVTGAVDRNIRYSGHQFGKRAAMVDLRMVRNHVIDL